MAASMKISAMAEWLHSTSRMHNGDTELSIMICANCGHDNQPTAAFCGHCGKELSAGPPGELPAEQPRSALLTAQGAVPITISRYSAAVGLLLLGLAAGALVSTITYSRYDSLTGGAAWVGFGGGMALGLWLSASVRPLRSGRLPSVVGLLLIGAASIAVSANGFFSSGWLLYAFWFGAFGAGIGLLLPRAFWLRLRHLPRVDKTALGIAAAIGLAASLWTGTPGSLMGVPIVIIGLVIASRHPVVLVDMSPMRGGADL